MIAIINYGAGNLHSVNKAFEYLGAKAKITADPDEIARAERVVLPGVGAFGKAAKLLKSSGMDKAFLDAVGRGVPALGICLGMQLLYEGSEEAPGESGLSLFKGNSLRFRCALKIPHMGWNGLSGLHGPLMDGIPENTAVYFVHSYYLPYADEPYTAATADYPEPFTASIARDNLVATQFHLEKSGKMGLKMLENFMRM
jgi:glutamine amidotransferase